MDEVTAGIQGEYERELKELRKAMGCTPERLMACPSLLKALQRADGGVHSRSIHSSIRKLERIVKNVSDPKYRDVLLVALRFDDRHRGHTLAERRESYGTELRRSRNPMAADVRTLERRENKAIRLVAWLLAKEHGQSPLTSYLAESEAADPAPFSFSRDLAVEAISQTYYFSAHGVLTSQDVTRWVRAAVPRAEPRLVVRNQYLSESRPGVLTMEAGHGCRVVEQSEDTGGSILTTLEIFKRLRAEDGVYRFTCRLLVDSDLRCHPVLRWRPPVHYTRRIEFTLIFHPAMTPLRAWWFDTTLNMTGQIEPSPAENRHLDILDGGRYVYWMFEGDALLPDHSYGIAWIWP